jgi:hypothetical protein
VKLEFMVQGISCNVGTQMVRKFVTSMDYKFHYRYSHMPLIPEPVECN